MGGKGMNRSKHKNSSRPLVLSSQNAHVIVGRGGTKPWIEKTRPPDYQKSKEDTKQSARQTRLIGRSSGRMIG